jgi:hypothetical protein
MGVIKGDRLAASDKLSQLSPLAAGHYSLFLSNSRITDDFGRFHLFYHRIWVEAFARRLELAQLGRTVDVVTLDMVRGWFAEYIEAGLVRVYESHGSEWAEWTNWQRKPKSKERFHRAPEPPESRHKHSAACGRTAKAWAKDAGADARQPSRQPPGQTRVPEIEAPEDARLPQGLPTSSAPSSPSAPSPSTELVVVSGDGAGGTADDDDGRGARRPDECPVCGVVALRVGVERDHWFCGDKRGGCGGRFEGRQVVDMWALVAEAMRLGQPTYRAYRESWHRRLRQGTRVEAMLLELNDGSMRIPGPPL